MPQAVSRPLRRPIASRPSAPGRAVAREEGVEQLKISHWKLVALHKVAPTPWHSKRTAPWMASNLEFPRGLTLPHYQLVSGKSSKDSGQETHDLRYDSTISKHNVLTSIYPCPCFYSEDKSLSTKKKKTRSAL